MPARVRYYTDPACSASWAAEPLLRKLMVEFGADLSFTYVMGGLAREYRDGCYEKLVLHWLERADRSRMPIDPRLWSEGPIRSSYPACMAVVAAAEQGSDAADRYLRRLREGLFCFRRKLDTTEALVEEARASRLDAARFRIDLGSHAIVEAFGAQLEEVRNPPAEADAANAVIEGQGGRRLAFPSVRFEGEDGSTHWAFGDADHADWRDAALAAGLAPDADPPPDPLTALRRFPRMATAEVAAVCDLPGPRAPAELWRLAAEGRVRPLRVLTGMMWELA